MTGCPHCQAPVAADARYCAACGQALGGASVAEDATRTRAHPGASPSSRPEERYLPGTVIGGRYRVIGPIGRGGMGEVYRADDLKLGQPVALKFLPRSMAADGPRLERLFNEVRMARQVAHPNVCRVHDVGEADGQHFLTMEFVDGEDLSSLLLRIGRLPEDKAVQIGRQLCAGLAAAHEQGVLHRDLKPANVMLDGRGRARITDFGLATLSDGVDLADIRSGTPHYMAPEQLEGREVTERSDLYALGLVLYEIFTGRRPFEAATLEEAVRQRTRETPTNPSSHVSALDPAIERVVLRCLEPDPRARPDSARAVAAALPGGDPLAAALAAGETPSPEMVAAAPAEGALAPGLAWGLVAAAVALFAAGVWLHSHAFVGLRGKAPEALVDRAREALPRLGVPSEGAHESWGFATDVDLASRVDGEDAGARARIEAGWPPVYTFWYRSAARPLAPERELRTTTVDPPFVEPGMVRLVTDATGRLVEFDVLGGAEAVSKSAPGDPYAVGFELAGLDPGRFREVDSAHRPVHDVDVRKAWVERDAASPLRVEAALRDGSLVSFHVAPDTSTSATAPAVGSPNLFFVLLAILFAGTLVAAIALARRNLSSGRGDRRGAFRLAAVVFTAYVLAWIAGASHTPTLQELITLVETLSSSLFMGVVVWILYVALEPAIRGRWPERIVGWMRALEGRFRDPLVGRDLLIGSVAAALFAVLEFLPRWIMAPDTPLVAADLSLLALRSRGVLASSLIATGWGLTLALGFFVLLLLAHLVLRRPWLAATGFWAVMMLGLGARATMPADVVSGALQMALMVWVMLRFGLLAWAVLSVVMHGFILAPPPGLPGDWYFGNALAVVAVGLLPALWGAWVCSGPRPRRI